MRILMILLLALSLVACESSPSPSGDEAPSEGGSSESTDETRESESAASASDNPEQGESDACVQECITANQMRAVSAEQIERDCRAECSDDASSD